MINTKQSLLNRRIGFSVSGENEKARLQIFSAGLARHLMKHGAQLVYGGDMRENGYTYSFAEVAYSNRNPRTFNQAHFINYLGWPMSSAFNATDEAFFQIKRTKVICADSMRYTDHDPDNAYQRGLALSHMRQQLNAHSDARICCGGIVEGYQGFHPGIFEEAWIAMEKGMPCYLIGAFPGASRWLIRALEGDTPGRLADEFRSLPDQVKGHHAGIFSRVAEIGLESFCKRNGLTAAENKVLFYSEKPEEITHVLLRGLDNVFNKN